MENNETRFIVDNMLGTLARWLRILGYDTIYDRDLEDWKILRIAEEEDRYIITRDKSLHHRALNKGLKTMYLWMDDLAERLAYIALNAGIRLSVDFSTTRCPEDNSPLRRVDKHSVRSKIPERVFKLHEDFWECPRCGKVYWVGRHWRMIEKVLEEARGKLDESKREVERGIFSDGASPK